MPHVPVADGVRRGERREARVPMRKRFRSVGRIELIIQERDQLRDEVATLRIKNLNLKRDLDLERLRCRGCGSTAGNRCPQCTIVCQA